MKAKQSSTAELTPDIAAALQPLARLLASLVAAELRHSPADDWIDQTTSPLGRRRHRELAKALAFPAHKEGRRWRARRADVDAYIAASRTGSTTHMASVARPAKDTGPCDLDDPAVGDVLAEVGLELAPTAPRSQRGRR